MRRSVLAFLALAPLTAALASCLLPPEPGHEPTSSVVVVATPPEATAPEATPSVTDEEIVRDDVTEPELQAFVPLGLYPSVGALCAAQEQLVAPRIAELRKQGEDGFYDLGTVRAHCEAAPLGTADVQLRAPYLEVRAIVFETGLATRKHVVVRTDAGWRALPHAVERDEHMDPGCFSIERETGLSAIRVEGRALVLVDGTDRGAKTEEPAGEDDVSVFWSDVTRRAVACRIEADGAACDAPVVLRVERVPSSRADGRVPTLRYETTYRVDERGHVKPTRAFDASLLGD